MGLAAWLTWRAGWLPGKEAAEAYIRRAQACTSENQFNRLNIDTERDHAPVEIASIYRNRRRPGFPEPSRAWLGRLGHLSPGLFRDPEPYSRVFVDDGIVLYRAPYLAFARAPRHKTLLIVFAGNSMRLNMPTAVFLQALPASGWDVLKVIRSPTAPYLSKGSEADDVEQMLRRLRAATGLDGYRAISVMGISGGGRIAAITAIRLAAERAILFGASRAEELEELLPRLLADPERGGRDLAKPPTRFLHCFGDASERDLLGARGMQAAFGGDLHSFEGISKHAMLHVLLLEGWLDGNLSDFLLPTEPPTPEDRAARAPWRRALS